MRQMSIEKVVGIKRVAKNVVRPSSVTAPKDVQLFQMVYRDGKKMKSKTILSSIKGAASWMINIDEVYLTKTGKTLLSGKERVRKSEFLS